ncbi:MAG: hypothetical protein U0802_15535 [Candidatus Binatia bacterium]
MLQDSAGMGYIITPARIGRRHGVVKPIEPGTRHRRGVGARLLRAPAVAPGTSRRCPGTTRRDASSGEKP